MTNEEFIDENETFAGYNCPVCGYPVVIEYGCEVCYRCSWSKDNEKAGYYDE